MGDIKKRKNNSAANKENIIESIKGGSENVEKNLRDKHGNMENMSNFEKMKEGAKEGAKIVPNIFKKLFDKE
jgi:hypothetical protein